MVWKSRRKSIPVRRDSIYGGPEVGKSLRAQRVERPLWLVLREQGQRECGLRLRSQAGARSDKPFKGLNMLGCCWPYSCRQGYNMVLFLFF